jgi:hypothetical protein
MNYDAYFKRYAEFSPTQLDHNCNIDEPGRVRSDWFVMPVGRNRDSGLRAESNFCVFLQRLGGESKTVEAHSFGHWANGWFEIIIVSPRARKRLAVAVDCARSLEDYPILDERDLGVREDAALVEHWQYCAGREFAKLVKRVHKLTDNALAVLLEADTVKLRHLWEDVADIPSNCDADGVSVRFVDDDIRQIPRDSLAAIIKATRAASRVAV